MLRYLCVQRKSVAIAALGLGLDGEAEAAVRLALVEAERLGLHDNASDARDLLGLALARQGKLDQALELCERGARECVELGARWAEGRARTTLAGLWLQRGDLERAEAEARHALTSLSDKAPLHAVALAVLGRVAQARGDIAGALDVTSQAMRQVESGSLSGDQETVVRLAHLEALRAAEDPGAGPLARESVASLSARAERISDPGHRESFLSRVPGNAELLALCRELGA
jgi:tetratricopeptide (TPR) repeat protein